MPVLMTVCQVTDSLASVEKDLNQPINPPTTLLLSHLDSDSAVESFTLYTSLSKSYKWLDKAHDYAQGAAAHLSQNRSELGITIAVTLEEDNRSCLAL